MRPFFCLAILALPGFLSAQPFSPATWLNNQESGSMGREGFLQRTAPSLRELPLLSKLPWRQRVLDSFRGMDPNVCVEGLFWLPYTEKTIQEAQLRYFQVSQSISAMKGMEYYSRSRREREVLILESYRVQNLQNRARLADLTWDSLPQESSVLLFQRDNTFGDNIYELRTSNSANQTLIVLENEERLFYGIMPLVDPGRLRMSILADFRSDGVLIYGASGAQTFSLFGLERSREESFFNRLKALADWMKEMF